MRTATLLLVSLAALPASCGRDAPDRATARRDAAVTVDTAPAALRDGTETFEAGGVVHGRTSATVATRMTAPIRTVLVRPGDRVRDGQALVLLDDRDVVAAARQADAHAAAAARRTEAARAERDSAQAALALARATHGRIANLHERGSATAEELDQAVAALRSADAQLARATAGVDEAQAAVDSARAATDAAGVAAGFARIVAPFDGLVTEKLVEPGNLVRAGMPVVRVEDTRAFELDARIDESRAAWLAREAPVPVVVDGPAGRTSSPSLCPESCPWPMPWAPRPRRCSSGASRSACRWAARSGGNSSPVG
jgi:RND family efflux transporter MFP subunit